jgi:hypothetical protein
VADEDGDAERGSERKTAGGVAAGAVAAGAGLAAAAGAKKPDEKPEPAEAKAGPAEADNGPTAAAAPGTSGDAPDAPAGVARDARAGSPAPDAKDAVPASEPTLPGSSGPDDPPTGSAVDAEAAASTAAPSTGGRSSLGGADLFASFSDGGKGRDTDAGRTPAEEPARAANEPAGRPAENGPAATPGAIDGPTIATRVPGAGVRNAPGTPPGGQARPPAGQGPSDQGARGQVPPGQAAGQAPGGQKSAGQNAPGRNAPGQNPAGQAFAGQDGRGPRGGTQESNTVSGAPQGGMLPPAGPDGEAPEEPRNAEAAALVAELPDEVLVIDEQPRYHLAGCRSLPGRPVIPIPAREAVELGFTPCGWCTPDRMLARRHSAEVR